MSQDRTHHRKEPGPTWQELAEVIAADPVAVLRLQTWHEPDGHRMCKACTTGGTGQRELPWPCGIRQLADLAAEIASRRGGET